MEDGGRLDNGRRVGSTNKQTRYQRAEFTHLSEGFPEFRHLTTFRTIERTLSALRLNNVLPEGNTRTVSVQKANRMCFTIARSAKELQRFPVPLSQLP